ncbi:MAG: hypothetical protein U0X91_10295 [Spirosomataceae bacterium]
MKKYLLLFFFLFQLSTVFSQQPPKPAASGDTLAWFDFWVGDWDLMWYGQDSVKLYGENRIEKIWNGTALQENFIGLTGNTKGYEGKSFSIYNAAQKQWQQTWIDNTYSYIPFIGGRDGATFYFQNTRVGPKGRKMIEKMVFYDIKPGSFVWDWKASVDDGATWTLNWQIFYTRKSKK